MKIILAAIIILSISFYCTAQIAWNNLNNGLNPITATADNVDSVMINVFTTGEVCNGLIVVTAGYTTDLEHFSDPGITSIQFSSGFLTKTNSVPGMVLPGGDTSYIMSEIWYAPIGTTSINSFVKILFDSLANDIIINVTTFENVDQDNPVGAAFGAAQGQNTASGVGDCKNLDFGFAMIDNLYCTGPIIPQDIGFGQIEISNEENNLYNGFSFVASTPSNFLSPCTTWDIGDEAFNYTNAVLNFLDCPLPVSLIDFTVTRKNDSAAYLKWSTSFESNNWGFQVQRSDDGFFWEDIGFENGRGNTNENTVYIFEDEKPLRAISYYRLKQLDFNGKYEFSDVISFTNTIELTSLGGVYPNPANDFVNVEIYSREKQKVICSLLDMTGKLFIQQNFDIDNGENTVSLDVRKLISGLYGVKVEVENQSFFKVINIENQ